LHLKLEVSQASVSDSQIVGLGPSATELVVLVSLLVVDDELKDERDAVQVEVVFLS
jgi:translation initiation factor 6 (eIF-6)